MADVRPTKRHCKRRHDPTESFRMFFCRGCRTQVAICTHCDRGQEYCGRACAAAARRESLKEAGRRYQASEKGRRMHAERQARYRERKRAAAADVTHQGIEIANPVAPSASPPRIDAGGAPGKRSGSGAGGSYRASIADGVRRGAVTCWYCGRSRPPFARLDTLKWYRPRKHSSRGTSRQPPP